MDGWCPSILASCRFVDMQILGRKRAPEFTKGMSWVGKPHSMKKLRGKVVMVHFWTNSCLHCHKVISQFERLYEKYRAYGLMVIGVHTPEYAFERTHDYVERAVKDLGISYPVVSDGAYVMWNLYGNRSRPKRYIIGHDGRSAFEYAGEGGSEDTERAIQEALFAAGETKLPETDPWGESAECPPATQDVRLGYLRGSHGNPGDALPDVEEAFTDVPEHVDNVPYFHGHWKLAKEYAEHTRRLPLATEYIALRYSAFSVSAVLGARQAGTRVEVQLDGGPIPESLRGRDIVEHGRKTFVEIDEPGPYRLVDAPAYHRSTLRLLVADAGLQVYALLFGACKE